MPRSRSRFSKKWYNSLAADEKTFYKGYLDGTNKVTVGRKPAATELKRYSVALIPFGVSPDATEANQNKVLVGMTAQAIKIGKLFSANLTIFGLDQTPADGILGEDGFYPALCKVNVRQQNVAIDNRKSQFTNKDYKYKPSRSGSIPFGRTNPSTDKKTKAAETDVKLVDYEDCRSTLEAALRSVTLSGGVELSSISFLPEVWQLSGEATKGNASVVTGAPVFTQD